MIQACVDCGERDVGLLAGGEPGHLDRNLDRAARAHHIGGGEHRRERAAARIDPEPCDADRPPVAVMKQVSWLSALSAVRSPSPAACARTSAFVRSGMRSRSAAV